MTNPATQTVFRKLGLGVAIRKLISLDRKASLALATPEELVEREMLFETLNKIEIEDIGFDCNDDGVPDDLSIFQQASETGCCRLLPIETGRKKKARSGRRKK